MKRLFTWTSPAAILFSFLFFAPSSGSSQTPSQTFLRHLQGSWMMTGTVRTKPVEYHAEVHWVLQNQWLSFHMEDAASPPKYEANLMVGVDSSKHQYVGHWLDLFGGAGARVVGMGPLSEDKMQIIYPYEEGRFRNLFTYDSTTDTWSLTMESEGKDGHWSPFAQYIATRK